jgi:hypothetical protein
MTDLKGGIITDVEVHDSTKEVLRLWVRLADGKLVCLIPVDYRIGAMDAPLSELRHGGLK